MDLSALILYSSVLNPVSRTYFPFPNTLSKVSFLSFCSLCLECFFPWYFCILRAHLPIPRNYNMVFAMLLFLNAPARINPLEIFMSSLPINSKRSETLCVLLATVSPVLRRDFSLQMFHTYLLNNCVLHTAHYFFPTCPLQQDTTCLRFQPHQFLSLLPNR